MPSRFLIIDGYNLLHAAGMAQRDYAHGDLQRCRTRLIRFLLQKLSPPELDRAMLVFDARVPPPDRPSEFRISGLKVQFANPGGDADELIERLLAEHSAPTRVNLVSSDRRLQTAARRRGAKPVPSEDFFEQLERRVRTSSSGNLRENDPYSDLKQGRTLAAGEVAAWEKVFGDIPGATWSRAASTADTPPPKTTTSDSPAGSIAPLEVPLPPKAETRQQTAATSENKKKATAKRPSAGKSRQDAGAAGIPEVTWNDLCRWLEDDAWLSEFGPSPGKGQEK